MMGVHGMCVDLQQHDAVSGITDYHVDLHANIHSRVWEETSFSQCCVSGFNHEVFNFLQNSSV